MATATTPRSTAERPLVTLADLLRRLGRIPASRVRLHPAPGSATEGDASDARLNGRTGLVELVDGTLVEKAVGYEESVIALRIAFLLMSFVEPRRLGIVSGPDGMLRLEPGLLRAPDVAFISFERLPGRKLPRAAVPSLAPDLAVEVLSKGNTRAEIDRKLREFFGAGTRLAWIVDPKRRTVRVHTDSKASTLLGAADTLSGDPVLPGFHAAVREVFAEAGQDRK